MEVIAMGSEALGWSGRPAAGFVLGRPDTSRPWLISSKGIVESADLWYLSTLQPGRRLSGALNDLAITRQEAKRNFSLFHELAHSDLLANEQFYSISVIAPVSWISADHGANIISSTYHPDSWSGGLNGFSAAYPIFDSITGPVLPISTITPVSGLNVTGLTAFTSFLQSLQQKTSVELALENWQERQQERQQRHEEEYGQALAREILAKAIERRPTIAVYFRLTRAHAAFLAQAAQGTLKAAILVTRITTKMIMRARSAFIAIIMAVISTFMSHRHHREPADGSLLPRTPIWIAGGMQ